VIAQKRGLVKPISAVSRLIYSISLVGETWCRFTTAIFWRHAIDDNGGGIRAAGIALMDAGREGG